jgi:uncharacterized membrane protein (DUF106 family)
MKATRMLPLGQVEPPILTAEDPSLVTILLGAFGGLIAALVYLYKLMETRNALHITELKEKIKELEMKLDRCQTEHDKSELKFIELKAEIDAIRKERYK